MTVADQINILSRKIKQNEVQYDLDKKAAKISALSSGNLDKYEYLIGEDLSYKPSIVEQTIFYHSPLNKFFNKGFKKEHKKEGLLKRLKNIEDKNEEQLKIIGDETDVKSQIYFFDKYLISEAVSLSKGIKSIGDNIDFDKLSFVVDNKRVYSFKNFKTHEKLIKDLHNRNMIIDEAEIKQNEFAEKLDKLTAYPARGSKNINLKESVSKNVKKFYDGWEKIVYEFKKGILPFSKKDNMKTDSGDQQADISDTPKQTKFNDFLEQIKKEQRNIDTKLFSEYFPYGLPDRMVEVL